MGTMSWVQGGCKYGGPHHADKVGAGQGHGRCHLTWMVRWVLDTGMEVPTMQTRWVLGTGTGLTLPWGQRGGCRTWAWKMPSDMDSEVGCWMWAWRCPCHGDSEEGAGCRRGGAHHVDKVGAGHRHGRCHLAWTVRWVQDMGMGCPIMQMARWVLGMGTGMPGPRSRRRMWPWGCPAGPASA